MIISAASAGVAVLNERDATTVRLDLTPVWSRRIHIESYDLVMEVLADAQRRRFGGVVGRVGVARWGDVVELGR